MVGSLKGEKGMKYKAWEVIKMLTENPSLVFTNGSYKISLNSNGFVKKDSYAYWNVTVNEVWELVPQTVSFTEARKAAMEGKRPTIVLEGLRYTLFAEKSLRNIGYWLSVNCENGTTHSISTGMIDGLWTVEG